MTQLLAGFNGTIKKAQNKVLAEKIKYASLGQRKAAQTFKEATTSKLVLTAHGLVTGQTIVFTSLPNETSGLVTGRLYWVTATTNEIELAENEGGAKLTWTALGAEGCVLQRVLECTAIKARIPITLAQVGDGFAEDATSFAIETTGAQTGENSITDVLFFEALTAGELLGGYCLPSKLEESAAAVVTILSIKANNLVAP